MMTASSSGTLGLIQQLFESGTLTGSSDAHLLDRFVARRDEAAFAALVARHGAMVLGTCRAVLRDPNDADDAFQATFVPLCRKAGSIRGRGALGAWLHRVAYRVALQAGADAARRRAVEEAAGASRAAEAPAPDDLGAILHEEVERLPERFRFPVVLCDLEGLTRDQAADRLGWTGGSVRGRLARGRELLRRRLTRRGIILAVPLATPAALPEGRVAAAVRAAAGGASSRAAALAGSIASGWAWARFQAAATLLLILGATTAAFVREQDATSPPTGVGPPIRPVAAPVARPQPQVAASALADGSTTPVEGPPPD